MTPLVSVVVPVRHPAPYLRQAVESVLSQTYSNLVLVIVDDGSATGEHCALDVADSRMTRLRRETNGGASAARNDGWRLHDDATYVAFLDADDTWDARKLEMQVNFLGQHPECAVVGGLMRYVASDGTVLGVAGQAVDDADQLPIARGELCPFPLSSVLTRRAALAAVAGFDEPLGRIGSEDLDLLARLSACGRIAVLPVPVGNYRIHPDSAMAKHRSRINRGARFVRRRLERRRAGADLSWDAFMASDRPSWAERRQDAVERCYRQAALWHAERRTVPALWWGLLAVTINPRYTLRRLYLQRGRRAGLQPAQGTQ